MRFSFFKRLLTLAASLLLVLILLTPSSTRAAGFDSSNLISDGLFVNTNAMSTTEVQAFLTVKGGFLKDFSENGRSAAQIITDAAHGVGDASGTFGDIAITTATGTVNPQVLLVTLQKEQSLVTMISRNDAALNAAMGYGCPDSGGCNSAYRGFTKQVENAAWQFRYNYERAQGHGFGDYQVGQSFCFDDSGAGRGTNCGSYGSRATASLYRYTPHVYNGNYNFTQFFDQYFTTPLFAAAWGGQSGNPTLAISSPTTMTIAYRNTGSATWNQGTVNLGTVNPDYSWRTTSYPPASGWLSPDRPARLNETSVAPGQIGTFTFQVVAPPSASPGSYRLDVGLVADGIQWFNRSTHAYWDVTIPPAYQASWGGQSGNPTLSNGQTQTMTIAYKNTGAATWQRGITNLGTVNQDYGYKFDSYPAASGWISANRPALLNEATVPPGQIGTFTFQVTNTNLAAGSYRLDVGLVADGSQWFNRSTHAYWDVTVQ